MLFGRLKKTALIFSVLVFFIILVLPARAFVIGDGYTVTYHQVCSATIYSGDHWGADCGTADYLCIMENVFGLLGEYSGGCVNETDGELFCSGDHDVLYLYDDVNGLSETWSDGSIITWSGEPPGSCSTTETGAFSAGDGNITNLVVYDHVFSDEEIANYFLTLSSVMTFPAFLGTAITTITGGALGLLGSIVTAYWPYIIGLAVLAAIGWRFRRVFSLGR